MKEFDVQSIEIQAPFEKAFAYIADANNLPEWTSAFERVSDGRALMRTPQGSVEVTLIVNPSREQGTIDWIIIFPDERVARAYSRVIALGQEKTIFSFVLTAPPVPLEQLEGALEQQSQTLREELFRLGRVLSSSST